MCDVEQLSCLVDSTSIRGRTEVRTQANLPRLVLEPTSENLDTSQIIVINFLSNDFQVYNDKRQQVAAI